MVPVHVLVHTRSQTVHSPWVVHQTQLGRTARTWLARCRPTLPRFICDSIWDFGSKQGVYWCPWPINSTKTVPARDNSAKTVHKVHVERTVLGSNGSKPSKHGYGSNMHNQMPPKRSKIGQNAILQIFIVFISTLHLKWSTNG